MSVVYFTNAALALINSWFGLSDPAVPPAAAGADVAQQVEHQICNLDVGGSNPPVGSNSARYDEAVAGPPCCYNCGYREPCDEDCPKHPYWRAVDRIDWSKDRTAFAIDEQAFMAELDEPPLFFISRRDMA
jgi:hypothetical protein